MVHFVLEILEEFKTTLLITVATENQYTKSELSMALFENCNPGRDGQISEVHCEHAVQFSSETAAVELQTTVSFQVTAVA